MRFEKGMRVIMFVVIMLVFLGATVEAKWLLISVFEGGAAGNSEPLIQNNNYFYELAKNLNESVDIVALYNNDWSELKGTRLFEFRHNVDWARVTANTPSELQYMEYLIPLRLTGLTETSGRVEVEWPNARTQTFSMTPENIRTYIRWAKKNYALDDTNIALYFEGHGSPYNSILFVDVPSNESRRLDPYFIKQTLDVPDFKSKKFDVVYIDSCNASMVETAYSFKDVAEYFVANETFSRGVDWVSFLTQINSNTTSKMFAEGLVDNRNDTDAYDSKTTTASFSMNKMQQLTYPPETGPLSSISV